MVRTRSAVGPRSRSWGSPWMERSGLRLLLAWLDLSLVQMMAWSREAAGDGLNIKLVDGCWVRGLSAKASRGEHQGCAIGPLPKERLLQCSSSSSSSRRAYGSLVGTGMSAPLAQECGSAERTATLELPAPLTHSAAQCPSLVGYLFMYHMRLV